MNTIKHLAFRFLVAGASLPAAWMCVPTEPATIQRITVTDDALFLNDRRLDPPISLSALTEILGPPAERAPEFGSFVSYFWHEHGLAARVHQSLPPYDRSRPETIERFEVAFDQWAFSRGRATPVYKGVIYMAGLEISEWTPNKAILLADAPFRQTTLGGPSGWVFLNRAFVVSHVGRGYFPNLITISDNPLARFNP